MSDTKPTERPLSPFMIGPYYRPQLTSITSILTRITGNALIVAAFLMVLWLLGAAAGPESFDRINGFVTSWFGDLVFTLSCLALWYHYLAGIRHFIFDAGHGMEIETAERLGIACLVGSVVLTLVTLIMV